MTQSQSASETVDLGSTSNGPAALTVRDLVGAHLGLIANSGSGKSRSVRKILEVTYGRIQQIVIDDEDEFYTLRERFDYVIAGGEAGDCPATPENAEALALALLENGLSAILQIGSLEVAAGQEFVSRFLAALRKAPKDLWHPVLLVVDEAQRFAPNDGKVGSSDEMAEFAASARKRGFTLVVATGRFSSLDTKVRAHCVNWLIGRAGLTVDRNAAARELGFTPSSKEAQGLKALQRGQFWAFGPALALEPTLIQFGAVETTHLERGQARVPTPPAPKKLRAILSALSKTTAVSAEEPKGDRAANILRGANPAEIKAAEQRGYERGHADGYREAKSVEGRRVAHKQMVRVVEALVGAPMLNGDMEALNEAFERMKAITIGADKNAGSGPPRPTRSLEPEAGAALSRKLPPRDAGTEGGRGGHPFAGAAARARHARLVQGARPRPGRADPGLRHGRPQPESIDLRRLRVRVGARRHA